MVGQGKNSQSWQSAACQSISTTDRVTQYLNLHKHLQNKCQSNNDLVLPLSAQLAQNMHGTTQVILLEQFLYLCWCRYFGCISLVNLLFQFQCNWGIIRRVLLGLGVAHLMQQERGLQPEALLSSTQELLDAFSSLN